MVHPKSSQSRFSLFEWTDFDGEEKRNIRINRTITNRKP